MSHTKRSEEFQDKIQRLINKLLDYNGHESFDLEYQTVQDIIQVLRDHTTDASCMVKAKDDEPVFVLRGQDLASQGAIAYWIERVKWMFEYPNEKPHDKIRDAEACLSEFKNYRTHKLPD